MFQRSRRRGHKLNRDGPGSTRIKLAEMLKEQHGIIVDPHDIHQNKSPHYVWLDLCRWCADGTKDGRFIHVCSGDRMKDIVKSKIITVVDDDYLAFEVCQGAEV